MSITGTIGKRRRRRASPISIPLPGRPTARPRLQTEVQRLHLGQDLEAERREPHVKLVYPKARSGKDEHPLGQGQPAQAAAVQVDDVAEGVSRTATFNANPAACPAASRIGTAKATTPILPVPLTGPAYFVSHGGAKFPELIIVLSGYGVTVDLHSKRSSAKPGSRARRSGGPRRAGGHVRTDAAAGQVLGAGGQWQPVLAHEDGARQEKVTVRVKGRKRTVTRNVRQTLPAALAMPTVFTAQNGP